MNIERVYELDPSIREFVGWVKDRAEINRNDWKFIRALMQDQVGWQRSANPTEATLPLFTAEAYDVLLREVYPYVD